VRVPHLGETLGEALFGDEPGFELLLAVKPPEESFAGFWFFE
jgi:hypothetical protein